MVLQYGSSNVPSNCQTRKSSEALYFTMQRLVLLPSLFKLARKPQLPWTSVMYGCGLVLGTQRRNCFTILTTPKLDPGSSHFCLLKQRHHHPELETLLTPTDAVWRPPPKDHFGGWW